MLNSTRVVRLKLIGRLGIRQVGTNLVLQGKKYIIKMETQGITQNLIVYAYLFPRTEGGEKLLGWKEVKEIILKIEKEEHNDLS